MQGGQSFAQKNNLVLKTEQAQPLHSSLVRQTNVHSAKNIKGI